MLRVLVTHNIYTCVKFKVLFSNQVHFIFWIIFSIDYVIFDECFVSCTVLKFYTNFFFKMNLTKFKLLAWKNVRLRRFHWIVTSIEFLLPILVAYLLTRVASSLTETSTSKKNVTIFPTIPKEIFLFDLNETVTLYYAPSNSAIDGFMDQIKTKFGNSL